jgi:hypothetical protein
MPRLDAELPFSLWEFRILFIYRLIGEANRVLDCLAVRLH